MGFLSAPKIKAPPPPPPINFPKPTRAANPPTIANPAVGVAGARQAQAARQASGQGFGGTISGSPQGLTQPVDTAPASLLGG